MTISLFKLIQLNDPFLRDFYLRKTLTNIFYWKSARLPEGFVSEQRCRFSSWKMMGVNSKGSFIGREAFTRIEALH